MRNELAALLRNNRGWAERIEREDPGFFERLPRQQAPAYLWIGCSDSRVPANQVIDLSPGEVFVHRNIANVMVHTDLNCMSVIQFAVDVLKVRHILVVGHYGCGGVGAALHGTRVGLADNWIRHGGAGCGRAGAPRAGAAAAARHEVVCERPAVGAGATAGPATVVRGGWSRGCPS